MADSMLIDGLIKFCDEKSKNIKLKAEPQVFIEIKQALEELKALKDINRIVDNLSEMERIEYKALKEKNTPKKPLFIKRSFTQFYACPHCSTNEHYEKVFSKMKHCENCGGTFDWQ